MFSFNSFEIETKKLCNVKKNQNYAMCIYLKENIILGLRTRKKNV
jgi:hypothetical protein